jgi:hypothetical protein
MTIHEEPLSESPDKPPPEVANMLWTSGGMTSVAITLLKDDKRDTSNEYCFTISIKVT